jgi:DNA-binding NtrC family response regulator
MLVHSAMAEGGPSSSAVEAGPRDFPPMLKKSPNVRVLIVDDEPLVRWSLSETLLDHGYGVLQAGDGRGAVEALEGSTDTSSLVDVIMLDYRLPDSNNLQLLATIRAMSPRSQVVLMTAYGTPELAAEALRLGAFCVVNKPLEMQEVADLVSRAHRSSPA